ncbi:hypothetical protein I549_1678 [Mycobacterium avium subsp. avium 2285 (R)]|nr:hypothetical protein I549_1678 [Mycobacterium avium subsp. avium 2285 (R)]
MPAGVWPARRRRQRCGPGASAAAGSAGRLNMVTSSRPRDRPLRSVLKQTRGS